MSAKLPASQNPFLAADVVGGASFTIGAEASNIINVAVQLTGADGRDLYQRGAVQAYWSDDANGDTVTASAPTTTAIGTDGLQITLVTGKMFQFISESDGDIDINVTYAGGAATWYLVCIMPDGSLVVSAAVTFA